MGYDESNAAYSIQTINLTKLFRKKKHKGIFGFLRKRNEKEKSDATNVTVALDNVNLKNSYWRTFWVTRPQQCRKNYFGQVSIHHTDS